MIVSVLHGSSAESPVTLHPSIPMNTDEDISIGGRMRGGFNFCQMSTLCRFCLDIH